MRGNMLGATLGLLAMSGLGFAISSNEIIRTEPVRPTGRNAEREPMRSGNKYTPHIGKKQRAKAAKKLQGVQP